MESEPARETVRTLPIYRGEERPDKGVKQYGQV